ncbi:MAG: hypothetical protein L0Y80_08975 [Ignavibacteriae bacterium]|nr:hypothetical protein [Ignavibacteriota bacterium]
MAFDEGFWGLSYKRGNQEITSAEFTQMLQSSPDPSIYALYSSGYTQSTIADVFSFAGGFSVGYGLASKPSNTALAVAGGVVIVAAIVLDVNAKSMMKEAVTKYNMTSRSSSGTLLDDVERKQLISFSFSTNF